MTILFHDHKQRVGRVVDESTNRYIDKDGTMYTWKIHNTKIALPVLLTTSGIAMHVVARYALQSKGNICLRDC